MPLIDLSCVMVEECLPVPQVLIQALWRTFPAHGSNPLRMAPLLSHEIFRINGMHESRTPILLSVAICGTPIGSDGSYPPAVWSISEQRHLWPCRSGSTT